MLADRRGLTVVEYIILAALVLAGVGGAAWALFTSVAQRLDAYRNQL